jgi:hypothetical protein
VLELRGATLATAQKHTAIRLWADKLVDVNKRMFEKINFDFGGGRGGGGLRGLDDGFGGDDDMEFM